MWDDGANVSGPVIFPFTRWVLDTARKCGVEKIYFLSRDGELAGKIAALIRERDSSIVPGSYLLGSRHAWYNAAFDPAVGKHRIWVGYAEKQTIRGVLANVMVEPETLQRELTAAGFDPPSWDRPKSLRESFQFLDQISRCSETAEWFAERRAKKTATLLEYFRQEGVFLHGHVGLVDIGWSGSTLDCFREVIATVPGAPKVTGFFFGLHRNTGPDRHYFSFGPRFSGHWAVPHPPIIEMLVPGTHGQVLDFRRNEDGHVEPVLHTRTVAEPPILHALHHGALAFARLAVANGATYWSYERTLRGFIERPTREEAARWRRFLFRKWMGAETDSDGSLVPWLSVRSVCRRFLSTQRAEEVWPWPHAAIVLRWPRVAPMVLPMLSLKFRVDQLVNSFYGLGYHWLRTVYRMGKRWMGLLFRG